MSDYLHEAYEPDLDDLTRDQLRTHDRRAATVADVLDEWLHTQHGVVSGRHCVGVFLDELAARGYRVTEIPQGPTLDELLPPSKD